MMDMNKSIQANWQIYATVISVLIMAVSIVIVLGVLVLSRKRRR